MVSQNTIQRFLNSTCIAVVGVSRKKHKFGSMAYHQLKKQGYPVVPINPHLSEYYGEPCYHSISDIPSPIDAVFLSLKPKHTIKILEDAHEIGVKRVWFQQGCSSPEALEFCEQNGIETIHGECILMYGNPTGFPHNIHRAIWKCIGKLAS